MYIWVKFCVEKAYVAIQKCKTGNHYLVAKNLLIWKIIGLPNIIFSANFELGSENEESLLNFSS